MPASPATRRASVRRRATSCRPERRSCPAGGGIRAPAPTRRAATPDEGRSTAGWSDWSPSSSSSSGSAVGGALSTSVHGVSVLGPSSCEPSPRVRSAKVSPAAESANLRRGGPTSCDRTMEETSEACEKGTGGSGARSGSRGG